MESDVMAVASVLSQAYGFVPTAIVDGPAGTRTRNHVATDDTGCRWFVKTYPVDEDLDGERQALELSEFARRGGLPVPIVRRSLTGDLLVNTDGMAVSVAAYVEGARTAENGLAGQQWSAVGEMAGRLHRLLARHPSGAPSRVPPRDVCDAAHAEKRLDRLCARRADQIPESEFARWASAVARQRLADLPSVAALLEGLPYALTVQAVHGDLASPNLMLNEDGIAALIDFRPPEHHSPAWELGRIVLDPRTVVADQDWPTGLVTAIAAYREANPALPTEDLVAVPRVAAGYLACSVYPLSIALEHPAAANPALYDYARARHEAMTVLCERVGETERLLRDLLR